MVIITVLSWKDTLLDHVVLEPSKVLHDDVDDAGDEARQEANEPTHHPAADLQAPEALRRNTRTLFSTQRA